LIVLDTHIWIWWVSGDTASLSAEAIQRIQEASEVGVSVISCLEVARLQRSGKINLNTDIRTWLDLAIHDAGMQCLPITPAIAVLSTELAPHHQDPADRLIIATALTLDADLISADRLFPRYAELQGHLIR
jgi:PIN domain nuclease of toxin-antitoxin system